MRTVQNDKTMYKAIITSLSHWISLLCHDEQFDINFEPCVHNGSTANINTHEPVHDANGVLNPTRIHKKRSHIEIQKHGDRSNTNKLVLNNRKSSIKNKECELSVSKGHGRFVCPKLTCLPDKNQRSRQDAAIKLA